MTSKSLIVSAFSQI